jgi:Raf kinase inhibitor-like YbhB/YbcL family protein
MEPKTTRIFLVLALLAASLSVYPFTAAGKEAKMTESFRISSNAFENNGGIPLKFTCDGMDINPPLAIQGVPAGAKSLALIVDDPDAPRGMWVHWVVWNIDPKITDIREDSVPKGALQGMNDFRKHDYGGPCPPSGTHRYFFKLYALDTQLNIGPNSEKTSLEKAMQGHIISQAQIMGTYKRK